MKTLQTVFASVAANYCVSPAEVTDSIRAYLAHLMNDPDFRQAWDAIPKPEGMSEEELLLGLMMMGHPSPANCISEPS